MQGHSADLTDAVSGPHRSIARGSLMLDGKISDQLNITDGSITVDRTATNRITFDVVVPDPDGLISPEDMTSKYAPAGGRIQVDKGARLPADQITTMRWD